MRSGKYDNPLARPETIIGSLDKCTEAYDSVAEKAKKYKGFEEL